MIGKRVYKKRRCGSCHKRRNKFHKCSGKTKEAKRKKDEQ